MLFEIVQDMHVPGGRKKRSWHENSYNFFKFLKFSGLSHLSNFQIPVINCVSALNYAQIKVFAIIHKCIIEKKIFATNMYLNIATCRT